MTEIELHMWVEAAAVSAAAVVGGDRNILVLLRHSDRSLGVAIIGVRGGEAFERREVWQSTPASRSLRMRYTTTRRLTRHR